VSSDDDTELAYLWMKVKFVQKYMLKNKSSFEFAEKEFHDWIDGLMESRIEHTNRLLNSPSRSSSPSSAAF
jgi:hypothetical protein